MFNFFHFNLTLTCSYRFSHFSLLDLYRRKILWSFGPSFFSITDGDRLSRKYSNANAFSDFVMPTFEGKAVLCAGLHLKQIKCGR